MLAWQGITEYNSLHNRNILTFHGEGKEKKMIPVSIEKFADMTLESNQDMDRQELLQSLKNALRAKRMAQSVCSVAARYGRLGALLRGCICVLHVQHLKRMTAGIMK